MKRLPIFIVIWLLFIALKLVVAFLGLFTVPIIYRYRNIQYSKLPQWMRPWSNPEDHLGGHRSTEHSIPQWWIDREGLGLWSFFKYHAIRNPANGLRSFEFLDLDIDPNKVQYITPHYAAEYKSRLMRELEWSGGNSNWYLAWQGWQSGFKYVRVWNDERHMVVKLGWRIQPSDKTVPIDPNGLRVRDAGFATKFLPYRKG